MMSAGLHDACACNSSDASPKRICQLRPKPYRQKSMNIFALVDDGAELGDEQPSKLDELCPLFWAK